MSAPNLKLVDDEDADLYDKDPAVDQAERLNDAAMSIADSGDFGVEITAISMLKRALFLCPTQAKSWSNLGLLYWRTGQIDKAEPMFAESVRLDPESYVFQGNLGIFLGAVGRSREAIVHLEEAMRLDPDNLGPRWDRALLLLRNGNWREGLAEYDIRREHRGQGLYPTLPVPLWQGEDLSGKCLYIQGEQGIGDRFLFGRYFAWVHETWPSCKIMACVHDSMVNIFWEFRHFVTFLPLGVPWPDGMDYAIFLCSLPQMHQSTQDNIPPDPGLFRKRILDARTRTTVAIPTPTMPSLKVGICWTGNPQQARNFDRSIPLELLLPLAEHPKVIIYSFQGSPGQSDIKRLHAGDLFCDLGPQIEKEGWVGTGIALMEMDLIITVCTSIAHLAGVLQIPTWTMLCGDPYWVWQRSGDTTPWYPSMKLFRQRKLGEWQPVIDQVRSELSQLADEFVSKET